MWELKRIAQDKPGVTLRGALGEIKHHYANVSSACAHLPEWIDKGKCPGLRLDRVDGKLCLFFEDKPAENLPP